MGLLVAIGVVWLGAGLAFAFLFRLLGLRYAVRGTPEEQLFLPGLAPTFGRRATGPFRYARHNRPPSLRTRRATTLPTESF